jgi:hypothetical protein
MQNKNNVRHHMQGMIVEKYVEFFSDLRNGRGRIMTMSLKKGNAIFNVL